MGHNIKCIIGPHNAILHLANNWVQAKYVPLNNDFSVIPITNDLFNDMNELANKGANSPYKELESLSKSLVHILIEASFIEKIGYIETDYFGGSGTQSAISYFKGDVFTGPLLTKTDWDEKKSDYISEPVGESAINSILYSMGVEKRSDIDAFDSIGLGNYRSNEKLLKSTS